MTDYSCSFHHLSHARVPSTIKGCFIGQLFIQSPRPDRKPIDHKMVQRNKSECTITVRMKWAMPQHLFGAAGRDLKQTLRLHTVRRVNTAETQPFSSSPSPPGTSQGSPTKKVPLAGGEGKRGGWQGWHSCPSAAKEQLKREPRSFPTQTTFIGVAPVLLGLLSIKSSTEIGTLHRKGRDPPQNTKCQETFVTQDEETHTATAVQNVPAWKITGKQHGWFTPSSRARATQKPPEPLQRGGQRPND